MAVLFLESELNSYKTFIDKSVDLNKREIYVWFLCPGVGTFRFPLFCP